MNGGDTTAPRMRSKWGHSKEWEVIYQQTFIDTYSKVVFTKLYNRKTPVIAAECAKCRRLLEGCCADD